MTTKIEFDRLKSNKVIKELMKTKTRLTRAAFEPGSVVMFGYNAKNKNQVYDKTPLVLTIAKSRGYTLGLNLHWLPFSIRLKTVNFILADIKNVERLKDIPALRPCLKLYINSRISNTGIIVKESELPTVIRARGETFTGGQFSSNDLYKMAIAKSRQRAKNKK